MKVIQKVVKSLCILFGCIGIIVGCKENRKSEEVFPESLIPSAGAYTGKPELEASRDKIKNIENHLHKTLIGTKWKFEEFDMEFFDVDRVLIKGGIVKKVSPEGIVAEYRVYDDGVIEIMVMGMIKTGMWDGKKLVIDGLIGTQKE
ncbi:MAG: hypothetical protein N3G21_06490 [Candidatus Hydrogenedentes bacterium]|nr:hypothetical protein [Candidatus Hydrogenedentota bacterium]